MSFTFDSLAKTDYEFSDKKKTEKEHIECFKNGFKKTINNILKTLPEGTNRKEVKTLMANVLKKRYESIGKSVIGNDGNFIPSYQNSISKSTIKIILEKHPEYRDKSGNIETKLINKNIKESNNIINNIFENKAQFQEFTDLFSQYSKLKTQKEKDNWIRENFDKNFDSKNNEYKKKIREVINITSKFSNFANDYKKNNPNAKQDEIKNAFLKQAKNKEFAEDAIKYVHNVRLYEKLKESKSNENQTKKKQVKEQIDKFHKKYIIKDNSKTETKNKKYTQEFIMPGFDDKSNEFVMPGINENSTSKDQVESVISELDENPKDEFVMPGINEKPTSKDQVESVISELDENPKDEFVIPGFDEKPNIKTTPSPINVPISPNENPFNQFGLYKNDIEKALKESSKNNQALAIPTFRDNIKKAFRNVKESLSNGFKNLRKNFSKIFSNKNNETKAIDTAENNTKINNYLDKYIINNKGNTFEENALKKTHQLQTKNALKILDSSEISQGR